MASFKIGLDQIQQSHWDSCASYLTIDLGIHISQLMGEKQATTPKLSCCKEGTSRERQRRLKNLAVSSLKNHVFPIEIINIEEKNFVFTLVYVLNVLFGQLNQRRFFPSTLIYYGYLQTWCRDKHRKFIRILSGSKQQKQTFTFVKFKSK